MTAPRLVIAGAGGVTFPPRLLGDLCQSATLAGSTVVLYDPDAARLDVAERLARRMATHTGAALRIEASTDCVTALHDASFVISTFAVGGLKPWAEDNRLPFQHGVAQTVGDTVGPGGWSRALRTVPALVELAQTMEQVCPEAWLFNYANPMSALIRGVARETSIKVVGLCHGISGVEHFLAGYLGVERSRLRAIHVGLNHLCWVTDLRVDGTDAYPELRRRAQSSEPPPGERASFMLFDLFGLYPSPGARHTAEFFSYFLRQDADNGAAYGLELWPWEERLRRKDEQDGRLRRLANSQMPLNPLFAPSGERAVAIIEAIVSGQPAVEFANLPNRGLVPNLPEEAIVELPAYCDATGVHGIAVGPLPEGIAAVLAHRWWQIELTVAAALNGDRQLALQALQADPLIPNLETGRAIAEDLLVAQAAYLPRFAAWIRHNRTLHRQPLPARAKPQQGDRPMRSETPPPLALSRDEALRRAPFPLEVVPSVAELHRRFVRQVLDELRAASAAGRTLRLTLPVGPFDYAMLADAANQERVSWRHVVLYPIDEFALPDGQVIPPEHPWSLRSHLTATLLDRLDPPLAPAEPPRWLTPDTLATISAELVRAPLDLAFFGFGIDGHVAMNCPEPALSVEQFRAVGARHVHLSRETITQIAMGGAGGDLEAAPPCGLTLGMRELLGARALRIFLMRTWQPAVMRRAFFGPVTAACPASLVQTHTDVRATIVSYVAEAPWHETTQRP